MDLGPFILFSLVYAVVGVRVVRQLVVHWRESFDRRFTSADRHLVDQAAFFVLVPVSVALHELGHAVAVWLLGGSVLGWGYYGFAGYVEFDPRDFTEAERILVAAAGTIVNIVLIGVALGLVFGRRPPLRAAFNELLIQFALVSGLNALVLYPLLDLVSSFNGDWRQMYDGGVPALSAAIFVLHAGILGAGLWAWRDDGVQRRVASLTGAPRGRAGRPFGRLRPGADARGGSAEERALTEAARRVASGWPRPVDGALQRRSDGLLLVLTWDSDGARRAVMAMAPPTGEIRLWGIVRPEAAPPVGLDPAEAAVAARTAPLDANALTLALRVTMEEAERRAPTVAPGRDAREV